MQTDSVCKWQKLLYEDNVLVELVPQRKSSSLTKVRYDENHAAAFVNSLYSLP